LGAVRWWVADQRQGDCFYCVVDLHALTVPGDPAELRAATTTMATLLLAAGLDPDGCTLFVQSHVAAHTQLTWLLECTASMGELRRMTQFKDKSAKDGEEAARVGLFTYPVLMAADILLYDTDRVPVGDDQRQHLELARNLAQRFNGRYGPTFTVPEAIIPPPGRGDRIMDLQNPAKKMSKTSESPQGVIGLFDDLKTIERKVKRAVTDTDDGPDAVRYDPVAKPGVSNLLEMLASIQGRRPEEVAGDYTRYGPLKADLAAAVISLVEPIQASYRTWSSDPGSVAKVLASGAERADEVARATLARAADAIGLLAPY
jgi:tryptophanyl-tRNA synthetase